MTNTEFKSALSFTRIESVRIRKALKSHLVHGLKQSEAATKFSVDKGLLSKRVQRIKSVHFRLKSLSRHQSQMEACL